MPISKVKWFDAKKGYGFIENPLDGADIFVHYSVIVSQNTYKYLEQGMSVDFEFDDTAKGLQARNVRALATPPGIDDSRVVRTAAKLPPTRSHMARIQPFSS
ncbi:MAG: cold shock domain-containing protein [Chlorobiaceae bacterium]|nr:cold shock domain-containing protein [Chlorobiaceae bacterium]